MSLIQIPTPTTTIWHLPTVKKGFCGNCVIQHPMPRDLGWISPIHASGNKQTDVGLGCGPNSGPWTSSSPPQPWSRSPLENTVLESHPWTRELLWTSKFPAEKSQHTTGAKPFEFGCIGEGKRNSLALPVSPLPKVAQLSIKRNLPSPWSLSQGVLEWTPSVPGYVEGCQSGLFLSSPFQSTESWAARLGKGKRCGEWHIGHSEGIKDMQTLFTESAHSPSRVELSRWLVSIAESLPKSVGQGKTTNLSLTSAFGKAKGRLSALWSGACRIKIEGIQA